MDDTRLGALLLENPMVHEAQIEHCLQIQALTGGTRPIGQILVDEGIITAQMLEELLELQARRRRSQGQLRLIELGDADRYLSAALSAGASELLLTEGRPAMVRIGTALQALSRESLAPPEVWQLAVDLLGPDALDVIADRMSLTRELHRDGVCRGIARAFRHFDGICVTVRLHPEQIRSLDAAGIPPPVGQALQTGKGMILVVGQKGSGISETLATLTNEIVRTPGRIVQVLDRTLEAPIPSAEAIVVQRRVGEHTPSYASGLRAAFALDPDVLVIGDVSEPEAFDLALRAAESGRLVVAAVPARSVTTALERMLNGYPSPEVPRIRATLAGVLRVVLAVRLLPSAHGVGQVLCSELLVMDDAAQAVLRDSSLSQIELLWRLEDGCSGHSLDDDLMDALMRGKVLFEDAFPYAKDKNRMLRSVKIGAEK